MFSQNVDIIGRVTEPFYIEAALNVIDENGVDLGPIDFSNSDMRMHVRETYEAARVILELTSANGRLIPLAPVPPGNANLAMSVPKNAMSVITARSYVYDLRYWDGPVLLYGTITFGPGVTR